MVSLAERLRHVRSLAGISAGRLGLISGLSRATVPLLESGDRPTPSGKTIAALAAALGVSNDYLQSGLGPEPVESDVKAAVARAEAAFTNQGAA
jgi:transcriptional regulator with XRE-family HTH domain